MAFPEHVDTDRLTLRRWRESDRDEYAEIWADQEVWRSLRGDCPFDPAFGADRFEHHTRHWQQHGFGLWAMTERATGQVAGWTGATYTTSVLKLAHEIEIDWTLRRPFWGRGLASEGAGATVRICFAHLGLNEVISLIRPNNLRSIRVAERVGMRKTRRRHRTQLGNRVLVYSRPRE